MAEDVILSIGIELAKQAAESKKTLEERLKAAMMVMKSFWLSTNDDLRFKAAVGAVFLLSEVEDKIKIEEEIQALKNLNAMLTGIPVNIDEIQAPKNPIGLIKMWNEIKKGGE